MNDRRELFVVTTGGLEHHHVLLNPEDAEGWHGGDAVPAEPPPIEPEPGPPGDTAIHVNHPAQATVGVQEQFPITGWPSGDPHPADEVDDVSWGDGTDDIVLVDGVLVHTYTAPAAYVEVTVGIGSRVSPTVNFPVVAPPEPEEPEPEVATAKK